MYQVLMERIGVFLKGCRPASTFLGVQSLVQDCSFILQMLNSNLFIP